MAFEDYSSIEEFRIQFHGAATLRLLKRAASGLKQYELLAELTNGFFIGRDQPTMEAKLQDVLTIDFRYSPSVDPAFILAYLIAVDLVYPDQTFKRYSVGSNYPPSFSREIWSQTLNANFNDTNQIIGVFVPDPEDAGGTAVGFTDLIVSNEVPAGAIDGANLTFQTEYAFRPDSVAVFLNGLLMDISEYTIIEPDQIVLSVAPEAGENLVIHYIKG